MKPVPRWRIAAALAILAGLFFFLAMFSPYYFRNLELQNYVSGLTHRADAQERSDDALRSAVLDKGHELGLPVKEENVHIERQAAALHIDVRYVVRVTLPWYTVDLHFYPGAGSR